MNYRLQIIELLVYICYSTAFKYRYVIPYDMQETPHISMSCAEKHCNNCKINYCECKCHIEQMIKEADYEYSQQCKDMSLAELAGEVNTLQALYDRHKANQRDKDFVKILEIAQEALEEKLR